MKIKLSNVLKTVLTTIIILTISIPVSVKAETNETSNVEVEQLLNQYGYEIMETIEIENVKSFDSVDEIENYLNQIDTIAENNITLESVINVSNSKQRLLARSADYSDNHLFNWYNPFAGFDGITLLCWNNVYMGYTYTFVNNAPRFVSIDSVDSYLSGISLTWWDHKGYSKTFSTVSTYNDKVSLTVDGCYVLGIEIGGFTIGARRNASWKCSLTLY